MGFYFAFEISRLGIVGKCEISSKAGGLFLAQSHFFTTIGYAGLPFSVQLLANDNLSRLF